MTFRWYFQSQKVAFSVLRYASNCSLVYKVKTLYIYMHSMRFYKLGNLEPIISWTVNLLTGKIGQQIKGRLKGQGEEHLNAHKGTARYLVRSIVGIYKKGCELHLFVVTSSKSMVRELTHLNHLEDASAPDQTY